jgi:hypothetical protein
MADGTKKVSMTAFITAWEGSKSVAEVAEKTELKITSVQARASKYRSPELNEAGEVIRLAIPLKNMPKGGGAKLDTDEAMKLIAQIRGVEVAELATESDKLASAKRDRQAKKAAAAAE